MWFTSNGGVSWQARQNGLIATDVQCLFFMNNNTGWCGTETQHISKTTNAGVNWVNVGNFGESIWSIYFINENTGWAGLNAGKIAYTINSGNNWTIQDPEPYNFLISDLFFYNGSSGYAGIGFPFIYKTVNQGSNWGYQFDSSGSYKFSFIDSSKGWSGDTPGGNHISRTTNGGGPISYVGMISNYQNIPVTYSLSQNYPNPFNSQTVIRFAINKTSYVKLRIYDILGREKTIWQSDKLLGVGTHELSFDAKELSSGVYFYQLIVSDGSGDVRFKETRKMILIK
ncbi:MAG: T9SS type A sorting domain-containing protein [Ignavibacteria bacterium]